MAALGVESSADERHAHHGPGPVVGSHALADTGLFSDDALIELLDRFPRERLYALSMGTDPTRSADNRLALHDGVSGADLLRAVHLGRLWLNLTRVDRVDARYRRVIDDLMGTLGGHVAGFPPDSSQASLLISSPHAQVYYHADGPASALWHVRGRKRVWIYPALDPRYASREMLEDIFAGVRHEYLPYEPAYDDGAEVFDLEPGQWLHWPQNAPHRVCNLEGVNVSLTTEYFTGASRRRARVYVANRYFRTRLGWRDPSAREHGAAALCKTLVHGIARRIGLDPVRTKRHVPTLRVDANAPGGVVALAPSFPESAGADAQGTPDDAGARATVFRPADLQRSP